jgi:hypothetical protein
VVREEAGKARGANDSWLEPSLKPFEDKAEGGLSFHQMHTLCTQG